NGLLCLKPCRGFQVLDFTIAQELDLDGSCAPTLGNERPPGAQREKIAHFTVKPTGEALVEDARGAGPQDKRVRMRECAKRRNVWTISQFGGGEDDRYEAFQAVSGA